MGATKKIKNIIPLVFVISFVLFYSNSFAQSFMGPSCAAGNCQGKISVDASGNIGVGTITPSSDTKQLIIGATSDSSTYALRILSSNSSPLLLVRNDGKVSIATTTFTYALNVSGDLYVSGNVVSGGSSSGAVSAGNVTPGVFNSLQGGGTGAYAFLGSLGVATTSQAGLPQTLSVYGGGYFSGNVGIGTTAPGYPLDVNGVIRGRSDLFLTKGSSPFIGTTDNFDLRLGVNTTEYMRIATSGNVGIGTTTPSQKLDVAGNIRFSGALMPAANAGTIGQVLVSQGAGVPPNWSTLGVQMISNVSSTTMTWRGCANYCATLTEGGYTDWRMPTTQDIVSYMSNWDNVKNSSGVFLSSQPGYVNYIWVGEFYYPSYGYWVVFNESGGYWYNDFYPNTHYCRCVR